MAAARAAAHQEVAPPLPVAAVVVVAPMRRQQVSLSLLERHIRLRWVAAACILSLLFLLGLVRLHLAPIHGLASLLEQQIVWRSGVLAVRILQDKLVRLVGLAELRQVASGELPFRVGTAGTHPPAEEEEEEEVPETLPMVGPARAIMTLPALVEPVVVVTVELEGYLEGL